MLILDFKLVLFKKNFLPYKSIHVINYFYTLALIRTEVVTDTYVSAYPLPSILQIISRGAVINATSYPL